MNLHNDKQAFEELLTATSNLLSIPVEIVEKDYYVTVALKALSSKIENLVFKGGTSLTKCYQLLNRFSEDIDLSYAAEAGIPGEARKKRLKKAIVETMDELEFPIVNLDATRSRRNYNCYRAIYPSVFTKPTTLNPELVVETYVSLLPFPTTTRMVDNYIYRGLAKVNRLDLAETYNLMPFEIITQTIERTLVDKVFAICDYYMQHKEERHSRHLYDIHKIITSIGITDEIGRLIPEVRAVRKPLSICPSAQKDVHIAEILKALVDEKVYQKDYENITMRLLFVPESYDEVSKSIELLSKSNIWE